MIPAREDAWDWPRAAYVHVPFCAHKCGYCDFASVAGQDHLADRYLDALTAEMATLGASQRVRTIFVGGGTPTRLTPAQLQRLLDAIRHWLPLEPGGEWTVEANPETVDPAKVQVLAEAGVNRVSLGAQSFQPRLLATLERRHAPASVGRAVDLVRRRIENISLDLIFGVPDQTPAEWAADLDEVIRLAPEHLSCYGLLYEKGTRLYQQWMAGTVREVDPETERTMYAQALDRLAEAGYAAYEISNFARPGRACRHNLVYWANQAYFGFGTGAARYIRGRRATNTRELGAYIRRALDGRSAVAQSEELEPQERARETAVLMLRRVIEGIPREPFRRQTGFDLDALAGPAIRRHRDLGFLSDDGERVRLTRSGLFVADPIMADLL